MKLPNADYAIVERAKVVAYLVNPSHRHNRGKAAFFAALGYSTSLADALRDVLLTLARTGEVVRRVDRRYGEIVVVEGLLPRHTGEGPSRPIRTVWIIDHGFDVPRLVTAYPGKR